MSILNESVRAFNPYPDYPKFAVHFNSYLIPHICIYFVFNKTVEILQRTNSTVFISLLNMYTFY